MEDTEEVFADVYMTRQKSEGNVYNKPFPPNGLANAVFFRIRPHIFDGLFVARQRQDTRTLAPVVCEYGTPCH